MHIRNLRIKADLDRKTKSGILVIITVIFSPILWISDPLVIDASELNWSVDTGDEVIYNLVYSTANSYLDPSNETLAFWLEPLNNTQVIFEITYLPEIPQFLNAIEFIDLVLNQTKSVVRFLNGSEIPTEYHEILNPLLSRCLLPIGDWIYIDRLYIDNPTPSTVYELEYTYLSSFEENHFKIGNAGLSQHGNEGWYGRINMTTGLPITVRQYSRWHFGFSPSYGYDFSLVMLNI